MEYKILAHHKVEELEKIVEAYLRMGFRLHGAPFQVEAHNPGETVTEGKLLQVVIRGGHDASV